jgi:hypothetical protein
VGSIGIVPLYTWFIEPLESRLRRELELQDVRLLMNATMTYLKSAQLESSFNEGLRELIVMAISTLAKVSNYCQEYYRIPKKDLRTISAASFKSPWIYNF